MADRSGRFLFSFSVRRLVLTTVARGRLSVLWVFSARGSSMPKQVLSGVSESSTSGWRDV